MLDVKSVIYLRRMIKTNNDHDCKKNWGKFSKALKSAMAIEMLHQLKAKYFQIFKNIMINNDATTISRTKATFDPSSHKIADFNCTEKKFTSKLYDLKKAKYNFWPNLLFVVFCGQCDCFTCMKSN